MSFSNKFPFHYLRSQKYKSPKAKAWCPFVCQTWQPSFDGYRGMNARGKWQIRSELKLCLLPSRIIVIYKWPSGCATQHMPPNVSEIGFCLRVRITKLDDLASCIWVSHLIDVIGGCCFMDWWVSYNICRILSAGFTVFFFCPMGISPHVSDDTFDWKLNNLDASKGIWLQLLKWVIRKVNKTF